jgi:hypothetical protein
VEESQGYPGQTSGPEAETCYGGVRSFSSGSKQESINCQRLLLRRNLQRDCDERKPGLTYHMSTQERLYPSWSEMGDMIHSWEQPTVRLGEANPLSLLDNGGEPSVVSIRIGSSLCSWGWPTWQWSGRKNKLSPQRHTMHLRANCQSSSIVPRSSFDKDEKNILNLLSTFLEGVRGTTSYQIGSHIHI